MLDQTTPPAAVITRRMDEHFRPQVHYTAEKNMINDPNGLVHLDGEWHLFHQYNQHEVVHWGHATSTDLVHWTHLRPALSPTDLGQIYSGTAVVDHHNTSGLQADPCTPVLVAFFTFADHHDGTQSQGLAYSNDRGRSWTMHPTNPVLRNPGVKDFRDPKVLWHPEGHWVMVLAAGDHVDLYRSADLLAWTRTGSWGAGRGAHGGVWECPDLFPIAVEDESSDRWILSVSVADGAPAGGSGMQYFVGDFDGTTFTSEDPADVVRWHSWGKDYYAGITWANVPATDGRTLMIAWADNWQYRFDIPTTPFNGQLTVVHELRLRRYPDGLHLVHTPVRELETLRRPHLRTGPLTLRGTTDVVGAGLRDCFEIEAEVDLTATDATSFGFDLWPGTTRQARVGVRPRQHEIFVDRCTYGGKPPHPDFSADEHVAPLREEIGTLRLRVVVDRSSVEVFADRELIVDLVLPDHRTDALRLWTQDGVCVYDDLTIHPLSPIWSPTKTTPFLARSGEWADTADGLVGSAACTGCATLTTATYDAQEALLAEATVEISGSRLGPPTTVLAERAAGLQLVTDASRDGGGAILQVLLDLPSQQIEVLRWHASEDDAQIVATIPARLLTGTPYRVALRQVGTALRAEVDSVTLDVQLPPFDEYRCEAVVTAAEAVFTHIRVPTGRPVARGGDA